MGVEPQSYWRDGRTELKVEFWVMVEECKTMWKTTGD